ncbi:related to stress response protein rds1p [Rhynchosporium graminicola]|uniref:Related to stress response protein rds1p n=1 Tax=Rhynchosporium graminicola TaxID=2792576 RepID=A0A1E1LQC7_9HELO|nr:related to stress response protein rds1p [Rhynchosporium commune]
MPSIRNILSAVVVGLVTSVTALPAAQKLSVYEARAFEFGQLARKHMLEERQNPTTGLPDGLTDIDVLEFALTLENLETAFYQQGFAKFSDSDFAALGLAPAEITNLKSIQGTEATHVTTLTSAIAGAGTVPVAPCQYNFAFTDAKAMVATAAVLENVGVSAYLAAAPLIKTPGILTVAGSILTVEARHQTFIRTASRVAAIPSAFDTPLGIRAVFTLAAGFITSCPSGSNLAITPFPTVTMAGGAPASAAAGSTVQLQSTATGATGCAFVNGGLPGGAAFTAFSNGACTVPPNLAGITYVHLTSATPKDNTLTDAITVAGPMVMTIS